MWVVTTGKKAHLIQCTNYDCMCRFIITDDEISKDVLNKNINYVKCPICGKKVRLIEDAGDIKWK